MLFISFSRGRRKSQTISLSAEISIRFTTDAVLVYPLNILPVVATRCWGWWCIQYSHLKLFRAKSRNNDSVIFTWLDWNVKFRSFHFYAHWHSSRVQSPVPPRTPVYRMDPGLDKIARMKSKVDTTTEPMKCRKCWRTKIIVWFDEGPWIVGRNSFPLDRFLWRLPDG